MDTTTLLPVLVTALIPMVLGMIWYAKPVFGARWMRYEGVTPEMEAEMRKQPMFKKMIVAYIFNVILAHVLVYFLNFMVVAAVIPAIYLAVLIWLGYMLTVDVNRFLWDPRPKPVGYLILNSSHLLVSTVLMSVVLALWV